VVREFILALLTKDPRRRLGANGADEVKFHRFFKVSFIFWLNGYSFAYQNL
jgi:hypothetical protein